MTIPRLPGIFDFLGQGGAAGLQAYDQQRALQYEQARSGAETLLRLIQGGQLDPNALTDPNNAATFAKAKIPIQSQQNVVPSSKAAGERRVVDRINKAPPGSTEESLTLDLPHVGQIKAADFMAMVEDIRAETVKKYPAVGRQLAGVFAAGGARNKEVAAEASVDTEGFTNAAVRFVAEAEGDPKTAKAYAGVDPQYAELVANGQLSDEYFAEAARQYALLDENQRIKWTEAAARRLAAQREQDYFSKQDRSYDTEIQRHQKDIEQGKLSAFEEILLGGAQAKLARGVAYEKLTPDEQRAIQKTQKIEESSSQIDAIEKQRAESRGNFAATKNPPPVSGEIRPEVVAKVKGMLRRGDKDANGAVLTPEAVRSSPSLTEAEKEAILGGTGGRSTKGTGSTKKP